MTEDLTSLAEVVRADACRVTSATPALQAAAEAVDEWTVGRASTAARALFDTLAQAAAEAEAGLARVAEQVAAAAGEYDGAEGYLLRPR
ncbi:hypothetical protein ACFEMC_23155 [Kineococcus sp. DHX-1]|uniref:hypothetical protein n=1 Tax=Kineococcus sp. DHX-1 TaxID=3349638 RepID=UPI0036D360DB